MEEWLKNASLNENSLYGLNVEDAAKIGKAIFGR